MKRISILGSTGSIGTQALDVIRNSPDDFVVTSLACGKNIDLLQMQIEMFSPHMVVVKDETDAAKLRQIYDGIEILSGNEGLIKAATSDCDVVLNALVGISGMVPTYEAIKSGKDVALANKETLVAGGEIIMDMARKKNIALTPIDSEHSAIFQCLQGQRSQDVSKLILTGSGGPFRGYSSKQLKDVTVSQALSHPNWTMGSKITIDSATLMNKGLEFIEARWLFGFEPEDIDVVIHPESIIHSMIEMVDGAVIAQMGTPDMKLPISYALTYPERRPCGAERLSLGDITRSLTFEKPDMETFPCLKMAMEAIKEGGTYPAALNGANEVLVSYFLAGGIAFTDIADIISMVMDAHSPHFDLNIDVILEADIAARSRAESIIKERII